MIYKTPERMAEINSHKLLDDFLKIIQKNEPLVLDFSDTIYISSAALRALLIAAKSSNSKQLETITITNASDMLLDLLNTTGFTHLFKIE